MFQLINILIIEKKIKSAIFFIENKKNRKKLEKLKIDNLAKNNNN